jgi:protein-tyrosine phosphatase
MSLIIQPPGISAIIDGLYVSGVDEAKKVTAKDFDTIVNVAAECEYMPPDGISYVKIPLTEDPDVHPGLIRSAVLCVRALLDQQKRTLLHCHCGISRSPAIAVSVLVAKLEIPYSVAMAMVKTARPVAFTAQTPFIAIAKIAC